MRLKVTMRSTRILEIIILSVVMCFMFAESSFAQISPGDLSESHSHLEGMSNCTQCHTLGEKISNEKCLDCHKDLQNNIKNQKGFHVSTDIAGKECISCHSDHHGRTFEMIRFDKDNFNHSLTGYELIGAHQKKKCKDCHKNEFIRNDDIKKKKITYLGLNTECLGCHTDYHQTTLSNNCNDCHDFNAFKPAPKFNHNKTKFQLVGKHQETDCIKCHKKNMFNGQEFQNFSGIAFNSCINCHTDVHKNKFGSNCTQCHNEQSFTITKGIANFDHSKTRYKLENKHRLLQCNDCHKTKLTDPLKFDRCTDCHSDYHKGQFIKLGQRPDCSDCHSTKGFVGSSFSIEQHNKTDFQLAGAHMATPCFACHKKEENWSFREIGKKCIDCHTDHHQSHIDKKYYPESNCTNCHSENNWTEINFNHSITKYELLGKHKNPSCKDCHFEIKTDGSSVQKFKTLTQNCTNCHTDKHQNQFEKNGVTKCLDCHDYNNWKAEKFDHNKTRFILDGKHIKLACADCHKVKQLGESSFVQYKLNKLKCENCH